MLTAVILLLSVALIVAVGESVRAQCRRMLSRPIVLTPSDDTVTAAPAPVAA